MGYISNTETDRREMLDAIGIQDFDELLAPLPEAIRLKGDLNLPPALDEYNLVKHLSRLASKNADLDSHLSFLGAGIYDHFKPSVIGALQFRGEFASAYTPYQPEVSQGMLQAIYEYQTMICALTQMDLSNASMYDASTGLAEAALMAASLVNRFEIVVSSSVHPHYREVIQTYADSTGYVVVETPRNSGGASDLSAYKSVINSKTACVLVQHPNFFGSLEDVGAQSGAGSAALLSCSRQSSRGRRLRCCWTWGKARSGPLFTVWRERSTFRTSFTQPLMCRLRRIIFPTSPILRRSQCFSSYF